MICHADSRVLQFTHGNGLVPTGQNTTLTCVTTGRTAWRLTFSNSSNPKVVIASIELYNGAAFNEMGIYIPYQMPSCRDSNWCFSTARIEGSLNNNNTRVECNSYLSSAPGSSVFLFRLFGKKQYY